GRPPASPHAPARRRPGGGQLTPVTTGRNRYTLMRMGTPPQANQTVLLVEDNAIAQEGMAVVLRRAGDEVVAFPEGQEALDYLGSYPPPAVILLDMMIASPGLDGWRFLERRIRIRGADNDAQPTS